MSKIYRLHSGASNSVEDWTRIDSYLDAAQIDQIKDPAGATASTRITSIPSPFACIDLVRTAFKNVAASGAPEGISIFHKMVSDALDVGQVFFNSSQLTSRVDILPWDPGLRWPGGRIQIEAQSDLGQLVYGGNEQHRLYGETLQMYLSQDAATYNFDKLQQFYLLHYKEGRGKQNILGGTSPATLFFSSANDLDYVDLSYKEDKLFDSTYCPLYERSEDYILFLYALRESMPDFKNRFRVVDDYMELCLPRLQAGTRGKVLALSHDSYAQQYDSIALSGSGNHPEILGFELRCNRINHAKPQEESDFVIAATQPVEGLSPLVLPAYTLNSHWHYVDGKWPAQLKAPHYDPLPLQERKLPGQEIRYPYLTTSDFLEPYLLQLPFEPDAGRFFCGHFPGGHNEGYLLPLSPLFFRYFKAADLTMPLADGKPMFVLEKMPGNAVKAKLRVPVRKGRFIDMERLYTTDMTQQAYVEPDIVQNRGLIRSRQISVALYPFVKHHSGQSPVYTTMLLDHDLGADAQLPCRLSYYSDTTPGQALPVKTRRKKSDRQQDFIDTSYEVLLHGFDHISIEKGKTRGCLVPLFPGQHGSNREFAFAIDFGTTNTHIEYSIDKGQPMPFDIGPDDQQLATLHRADEATYNHLTSAKFGKAATLLLENVPQELMPAHIGGNSKYKFPRRTVVSEPVHIDLNNETYPLADFSIYWQYEEGTRARQLRLHTNLKWSNLSEQQETEKRIGGYIANLVLLIRNKVLRNGGDLSRTKITWFYPTSMTQARRNTFEHLWDQQLTKYMGPSVMAVSLPESVAPFYFFRNQNGVRAGNEPVINIDIGGGTTDIVAYRNEAVASYTSFRFAGNALFGDGYNNPPSTNGFVRFFEKRCRNALKDSMLAQFLPPPGAVQQSDDFITTLFGLQHHPDRGEAYFSFTDRLRETEELKIVPLLFISSILYHTARYQQAQGEAIPRFITFSGSASKMLHILDVSKGFKSITQLANQVFNDVFGSSGARIELVVASGPKEVTAKGGLYNPAAPSQPKSVLYGTEALLGPGHKLRYQEALEETTQQAVVDEVCAFIDLFFSWDSKLDFAGEFGLNTARFAGFKKILKTDLDIFLVEGIYELKEELNRQDDGLMNETLFFMPLKGVFNKLAYAITDNLV